MRTRRLLAGLVLALSVAGAAAGPALADDVANPAPTADGGYRTDGQLQSI